MKTQDQNPFDAHMRDKFENFEVKAPSHVWDNIVLALDEDVSKKVIPLKPRAAHQRTWWAAASLLLCTSLGWWMLNQQTPTVYLQSAHTEDVAPSISEKPWIGSSVEGEVIYPAKTPSRVVTQAEITPILVEDHSEVSTWERPQAIHMIEQFASISGSHPVLVNTISLQTREVVSKAIGWEESYDSRSVRMSDMLNFMVAQVDKREEKFIYFSDSDEGSIKIDLNLGLARTQ